MRAMLVGISLTAVMLAGCADEGARQNVAEDPAFEDLGGKVTSTTGLIRGVVFDAGIVPIEGAKVVIQNLGRETTTTPEGAFILDNLEPGPYFLQISKIGYTSVQQSAQVEAGVERPPIVKVQLQADPGALPFAQTTQWEGHLRCAGALVIVAFPCSIIRGTEDLVQDYNGYVETFQNGTIPGLPDFYQTELVWESTQALGESLILDIRHCCDNDSFGRNGSAIGPSPLITNVVKHEMEDADVYEDGMEIGVFGAGLEATQAVGYGVGFQLEQPLTAYRTFTINFRPVEGWTFIEDGAVPLPA